MPDVDALTRDTDEIRTAIWDESRPTVLAKGMLFTDKTRLRRAAKIYSIKECREITVWESTPDVYKVVCHRWFTGCYWMLRASKKKTGMWKVGKYIGTHTCEMDTFSGNHFNLDVDLISLVLIPHIKASIRYKIKECITSVHQEYGCTITKRKAFLGCKRMFEIVYGNWDKSFAALPNYMAALQHFNPGIVVEWKLERSPGIQEYIFKYVFWAFKPAIDGFLHCRPVIYIDVTHIYGKYDIKLLIAVAVDANGSIIPLDFAICDTESQETWTLFLNHLKEHVVKQRLGICLISDRQGGIICSVENFPVWQEPYAYHHYCVRHLKANFQKEDEAAYRWLMRHKPDKWTLHADGGRRWEILTTNVSESFNGLLKSARGLPITAMVRMSFKQMAERFVERATAATSLMERGLGPTNYVDKQYSVVAYLNTYSGQLQPVGDEHYWPPEPFKMEKLKEEEEEKNRLEEKLKWLGQRILGGSD
ncbi:uncharacterized protein [Nicotiana tomentosiformis]|uniref:uncharacterized protein n=1 Tax=Nicotiana tomentosiformis TaxID=4098 RepID=UPI00388CA5B3